MSEITEVIVSDTETTGFDPAEGAVLLEVAAVRFAPVLDAPQVGWQSYVEFDGVIPPEAKSVHHIKESSVAPGAPDCNPREAVIETLLSFESEGVVWAFHNAAFDLQFLPELSRPVICTYRCAMHLWPDAPNHKNMTLMYWLGVEPDRELTAGLESHRALFDSAATTAVLRKMLETHTIEKLIELTNTPILLDTVRFGKHKGEKWRDVPRDYAQWCLYKSDMAAKDPDLKFTLEVRLGLKDAA